MKKLTIRLSDDTLIQAIAAIPAGSRHAVFVAALRAYLLPGGQQEVLNRLDQVLHRLDAGPAPPRASATTPDDAAMTAANRTAILGAFGIEDDE
uniref:Uncharacterized protein n=1 Tax=Sulfobacillus thermotolerans TaxID=338644 RepID=G5CJ71_9FIRM|nr:hypothetical protein [Sulfobacillus thermotolerans]AEP14348.1 hypothetical protein [Sulfobacillus thermotolerans]